MGVFCVVRCVTKEVVEISSVLFGLHEDNNNVLGCAMKVFVC